MNDNHHHVSKAWVFYHLKIDLHAYHQEKLKIKFSFSRFIKLFIDEVRKDLDFNKTWIASKTEVLPEPFLPVIRVVSWRLKTMSEKGLKLIKWILERYIDHNLIGMITCIKLSSSIFLTKQEFSEPKKTNSTSLFEITDKDSWT